MHKTCIKTAPIARRFTREQRRTKPRRTPCNAASAPQNSPSAPRTTPPTTINSHPPRPPPRIEPRRTHHAAPDFPNLLPPTRALPPQKIFFAEFIPVGDRQPRSNPTNRPTPKRCQNPCYTAVVGGKPAKEKPSVAADGRKEVHQCDSFSCLRELCTNFQRGLR